MTSERGRTLVLGTRKGCLVYERCGDGWQAARSGHDGVPVPYAFVDARTGVLWAALDHGHWGQKLSRSPDLGRSWSEAAVPAYPQGCEVLDRFGEGDARKRIPATLRYLWVLAPGGVDEPARLYAGTEPGGLFVSEDDGASWELVRALWDHPSRLEGWFGGGRDQAGIHSILVDPRDSRRVLVGVSCAGVFETVDGGATWQVRNRGLRADFLPDPSSEVGQDPHLLAWCPSAPDHVWQQNHCGVFASDDGARSWREVSQAGGPVRFGFPIAVDEHDPRTAWVVPAQSDARRIAVGGGLCVSRTSDGGATWTALRAGLPQEECWDVVYRHALDLAGDTLAFGSTTGNVYWSDDCGESWRALGHHLPPVYSVRFA
jgi:photosystem II stability/assembly factor-like uncharacterized protein